MLRLTYINNILQITLIIHDYKSNLKTFWV